MYNPPNNLIAFSSFDGQTQVLSLPPECRGPGYGVYYSGSTWFGTTDNICRIQDKDDRQCVFVDAQSKLKYDLGKLRNPSLYALSSAV